MKLAWVNRRNAIIGSPAFQRWASRFALTRPVARQRARELFSLVAGFVYSQVTLATVRTGLLDILAEGPIAASQVAERAALPLDGADRLLKAAASLGLAERFDETRFVLGSAGAALRANDGIASMILHHPLLYQDLADPVALLRGGGGGGALSQFWPYAESRDGSADAYSKLMAASQPMVAEQAIDSYPFKRHTRMLDIGGGAGAFVRAVKAATPGLDCAVFDLPDVVAQTRALHPDLTVFAGSFFTDPLPTGFDLLTLVRILHDHDDAAVMQILRTARAAIGQGGRLVIVEPMAATRGDERVGDAYFGFYLLAMGTGRARSPQELVAMLKAAGFSRSRVLKTALPLIARTIVADA